MTLEAKRSRTILVASRLDFVVVVPARLASTRLPNKPLADIGGAPMVVRVAQRAACPVRARWWWRPTTTRLPRACEQHGVRALMTRADHASGSDRLAEACTLLALQDDDVVVNVQGDEPLIEPALIDVAPTLLDERSDGVTSTVAHAIHEVADYLNPNVVKVVLDAQSRATALLARAAAVGRDGSAKGVAALPLDLRRCATSACTLTVPASCAAFRCLRWRRWSAPKRSSNCACSGTASASPCTSLGRRRGRAWIPLEDLQRVSSVPCTPNRDNPADLTTPRRGTR